jgi:tetratricopeptide (TPR) repeat protein
MRRLVVTALALCGLATAAAAQPPQGAPPGSGPPAQEQKPKNLKVLPADLPMRAVRDTMSSFARALGVRCTHCHVGTDGQPQTMDFAADDKPEKEKAREMMRMATAINADYLAKLTARRTPRIVVGCATCHRGLAEPRPLQQVVLSAYEQGGADSAEARYRALRQQYYGRAAYDFGDAPLADVATTLRARDRLADAVRLHRLNTEFSPNSAFAFRQAATALLAAGDTTAAIASLEKVLTLTPNDVQARRVLDMLPRKP